MHLGNLVTNKKSLESSSFSSAAKRIFESFFEYDQTLQNRLKNTQLGEQKRSEFYQSFFQNVYFHCYKIS